jgi:hypothetical protein
LPLIFNFQGAKVIKKAQWHNGTKAKREKGFLR